jgi:hypothetical protein
MYQLINAGAYAAYMCLCAKVSASDLSTRLLSLADLHATIGTAVRVRAADPARGSRTSVALHRRRLCRYSHSRRPIIN